MRQIRWVRESGLWYEGVYVRWESVECWPVYDHEGD